jgi:hypothetical protein
MLAGLSGFVVGASKGEASLAPIPPLAPAHSCKQDLDLSGVRYRQAQIPASRIRPGSTLREGQIRCEFAIICPAIQPCRPDAGATLETVAVRSFSGVDPEIAVIVDRPQGPRVFVQRSRCGAFGSGERLVNCLESTPRDSPPPLVQPPPGYLTSTGNASPLGVGDWCWSTPSLRICRDSVFPRFDLPIIVAAPGARLHFGLAFIPVKITLRLLKITHTTIKVVRSFSLHHSSNVSWRVPLKGLPRVLTLSILARPPADNLSPRDVDYLAHLCIGSVSTQP